MAKCTMEVSGTEANEDFRMENLCGDMEAIIKGGVCSMSMLCQHNSQEEDWGFLLINEWYVFNEEKLIDMLWAVWYKCTSDV